MAQELIQKIRLCLALIDNNTSDSEVIKCIKQNLPEFAVSRLSEPDKKIEFDGNMIRKNLYRDLFALYLAIIIAIILMYIVFPPILPFVTGNEFKYYFQYSTGGATIELTSRRGSSASAVSAVSAVSGSDFLSGAMFQSGFKCEDSSTVEKIVVAIGIVSVLCILSLLVSESYSMFVRENEYYKEITTDYNPDSKFNYDKCLQLRDNKLMVKLVVSVLLSIILFIAFTFVFVDQLTDFPSYFYGWSLILTTMFFSGITMMYKYFMIFGYTSDEYDYKCDKFFPSV